ncbi:glycosyltransferase family 4 protein [Sediminibacterium sp.]|uniref:glycosyltransferase family 4 protein n=1 Tax=Sediminibacterium sp. TaxID=1917865 RepID=UPI002731C9B9|nr:glycosyltransferase family 4 protein [Sediminibacterium sp.]MDP2420254.1 glycosyltransferase family 4 protein [Sediminibacterium sp.]
MEPINLKKVLIHSIVFSPDGVSTAYLYNDIALGLVDSGFDVVVLTTTPHYNLIESELSKQPLSKKIFGLYYVSNFKGIEIYHIPLKKYKNTLRRIFSFVYWHLASFILGLKIKKIHFVLSPSPPLSIGLISLLIAKIKGAKAIYNVQEIYPDLLINQGSLNSSFIINLLKKIEKFIYNYSDAVTTIDKVFYSTLVPRFDNFKKLHIIPNFVDTDLYKPLKCKQLLPAIFGEDNKKIKILYAGNIGFFQDWAPVLFAAKELSGENIEFWIIGEGVQKEFLEKEVQSHNLTNVRIFPYQRRELLPIINNHVDIHFIAINQKMEQEGFPSKVYTIMACAKPLVVITSENTPLYNFLKGKNCAELVTNDRNVNFTNAIRKLSNHKELREELGVNGYKEIINNYSKKVVVSNYANLLNSL